MIIAAADDNVVSDVISDVINEYSRLGLDGEACVNRLLCEVTAHPMVTKVLKTLRHCNIENSLKIANVNREVTAHPMVAKVFKNPNTLQN